MSSNVINNYEEFNHVINNGRVVIIDFHANWSGCSDQHSGQQLSDFSETFKLLGVDLYSVDVDEADDVVLEVDVRVIPTFMVFKDGNKVGYAEGVGAGNLHKLIGSHIAGWTAFQAKNITPVIQTHHRRVSTEHVMKINPCLLSKWSH